MNSVISYNMKSQSAWGIALRSFMPSIEINPCAEVLLGGKYRLPRIAARYPVLMDKFTPSEDADEIFNSMDYFMDEYSVYELWFGTQWDNQTYGPYATLEKAIDRAKSLMLGEEYRWHKSYAGEQVIIYTNGVLECRIDKKTVK